MIISYSYTIYFTYFYNILLLEVKNIKDLVVIPLIKIENIVPGLSYY